MKTFNEYCCDECYDHVIMEAEYQGRKVELNDPFRARHNCADPGPKYKARYWSCFQWRAGAKVDN